MLTRTGLVALVAAALIAVAVPATAGASGGNRVPLRGVVSGSPYGASNGQMAIPVLFSKITAQQAGLKSPVGVIIVPRNQKVKLPAGTTIPVNLRNGDRFKGVGVIGPVQQRVFYPRVVFSNTVVYFRSKELSISELSTAVAALQTALVRLQAQLTTLAGASQAAFRDLYQQVADLRSALASLKLPAGVDLTQIQSQIDALTSKLNDLIASLPDFSQFALTSQLPDLSQYAKLTDLPNLSPYATLADLTGYAKLTDIPDLSQYAKLTDLPDLTQYAKLTDLPDLSGYATTSYVDNAISGLQTQINALPTTADVTTAINSAISGLNISQYATTTYVDGQVATLKAKINQLVSAQSSLCTSVKTLIATLTCPTITTLP